MKALLVMCLVGAASASAGIDDSANGWEKTPKLSNLTKSKSEQKLRDVYRKDYSTAEGSVRVKRQVRSQTNANL